MRLFDIQNLIIASGHLTEEKLEAIIEERLAEFAWWCRNTKWDTHHRFIVREEDPLLNAVAIVMDILLDVNMVTHKRLINARNTIRLYMVSRTPSKNCITKMRRLQGKFQDDKRDELELVMDMASREYFCDDFKG